MLDPSLPGLTRQSIRSKEAFCKRMDARIKSAHDGGAYGDVDDRNDRLSGDTPMTLLETRDLTIRFGGHVAVNSVSCTFRPGELTAIVGPNGAGKTTYFNLI